jgi:hypothetical protein
MFRYRLKLGVRRPANGKADRLQAARESVEHGIAVGMLLPAAGFRAGGSPVHDDAQELR